MGSIGTMGKSLGQVHEKSLNLKTGLAYSMVGIDASLHLRIRSVLGQPDNSKSMPFADLFFDAASPDIAKASFTKAPLASRANGGSRYNVESGDIPASSSKTS